MDIAAVVIPVFSIAVLGYLVTWAGLFRTGDIAGLTRYVFSVALPVMLFDSMAKIILPDSFQWSLMISYYVPTLFLFGVTALIGRSLFRQSRPERAIFAMGASYSNTVLIGLPIVSAAWGDEGLLPLLMIVTVHAALLFLVTTALAEAGGSSSGSAIGGILRRTTGGMIRNPILIGLAAGLVANALDFRLPGPLDSAAGMIRASAVPAALFVTGASLREFRVTGHLAAAGTLVLLKMVVHPLLVWLPARFIFDLPPSGSPSRSSPPPSPPASTPPYLPAATTPPSPPSRRQPSSRRSSRWSPRASCLPLSGDSARSPKMH